MGNKEIQEARMKGYFIQATKEILKSEGLKSLSVRNIASRAGYSFATLYNYFRDVNDLVFFCVEDFQKECREFVAERRQAGDNPVERMRSVIRAYAGYFIEYPGIFELFFLERMGDFGNKQSILDMIEKSFRDVSSGDWQFMVEKGVLDQSDVEDKIEQTYQLLIGKLLLYLNRRKPGSYDAFIRSLDHGISLQDK